MTITATNFRPGNKPGLIGFVDLELPSGLVLREWTIREKDGKRWLSSPAKKFEGRDGGTKWYDFVWFKDADVRAKFQRAALKAVDALIAASRATAKKPEPGLDDEVPF